MFATLDLRRAPSPRRPSWLLWTWRDLRGRARNPAVSEPGMVFDVPKGRVLRVPGAMGQRIECLEGCIWVTMDEDQRDVIVAAGQTFIADRRQLVLIQALDGSRVRLIDPRA